MATIGFPFFPMGGLVLNIFPVSGGKSTLQEVDGNDDMECFMDGSGCGGGSFGGFLHGETVDADDGGNVRG